MNDLIVPRSFIAPALVAAGGGPLDALERLDLEWERAVRDLHRTGWRQ